MMRAGTATAAGAAIGGQMQAGQPKDTPIITRIGNMLEEHNSQLAALCKRLGSVADRTIGSVPQGAAENAATAPSHCTTARVDGGLSDYADGLRWLHGIVERLEQL
jgi:hypothetical protein